MWVDTVTFAGFCKWLWRMKLPVDGWSPKQNLNLGFIFFGRLGDRQKESLWHTLALNVTCGKITCALLSHSRKFDFAHHLSLIFAQLSRFGMWGTTCIKCLSCTNKQISCQKNGSEVLRCTYNLYRYTDTQITYDIYDILLCLVTVRLKCFGTSSWRTQLLWLRRTRRTSVELSACLPSAEALAYINDVGGRLVAFAGCNHVWRDAIPERFERQAIRGEIKTCNWNNRDILCLNVENWEPFPWVPLLCVNQQPFDKEIQRAHIAWNHDMRSYMWLNATVWMIVPMKLPKHQDPSQQQVQVAVRVWTKMQHSRNKRHWRRKGANVESGGCRHWQMHFPRLEGIKQRPCEDPKSTKILRPRAVTPTESLHIVSLWFDDQCLRVCLAVFDTHTLPQALICVGIYGTVTHAPLTRHVE